MDISIMKVTKIEVKKTKDVQDFSVRDIVFHSLQYCYEESKYVPVRTEVTCFFEDRDLAKLIYSKE